MADAPPPAGVKRERDGAAKGKGGKGVVAPAAPAQRVKDAAVCCPLVYGSLAFWLGRKADEFHTHKWTLFVRGPHGEEPVERDAAHELAQRLVILARGLTGRWARPRAGSHRGAG